MCALLTYFYLDMAWIILIDISTLSRVIFIKNVILNAIYVITIYIQKSVGSCIIFRSVQVCIG